MDSFDRESFDRAMKFCNDPESYKEYMDTLKKMVPLWYMHLKPEELEMDNLLFVADKMSSLLPDNPFNAYFSNLPKGENGLKVKDIVNLANEYWKKDDAVIS